GYNDVVDHSSWWYLGGAGAGFLFLLAAGGAAAAAPAGGAAAARPGPAQLQAPRPAQAPPPQRPVPGAVRAMAPVPPSTRDLLTCAAQRAHATVGPGRGRGHRTRVHTAFRNEVNALADANLHTEVSYLNGVEVPYGAPGSIRVDVVEGPRNA